MATNLIPFPRRWFDQQVEQSNPIAVIRAELAELRAALAEVHSETEAYRRHLDDLECQIDALKTRQSKPVAELTASLSPEVNHHNGCACGCGSDDGCLCGCGFHWDELLSAPAGGVKA